MSSNAPGTLPSPRIVVLFWNAGDLERKLADVSADELAVVRKRDKTYDRDREAAKPAGEVVQRLLARYPAP